MKVRTRSIIRFVSSDFCSPSAGPAIAPALPVPSSTPPAALLESSLAGARVEVLDIAEDHGTSVVGRSLQRGLVMSISPTQRMPYLSRKHRWRFSLRALPQSRQLVEETLVLDVCRKSHDLRMRADDVRNVQERQTHSDVTLWERTA